MLGYQVQFFYFKDNFKTNTTNFSIIKMADQRITFQIVIKKLIHFN